MNNFCEDPYLGKPDPRHDTADAIHPDDAVRPEQPEDDIENMWPLENCPPFEAPLTLPELLDAIRKKGLEAGEKIAKLEKENADLKRELGFVNTALDEEVLEHKIVAGKIAIIDSVLGESFVSDLAVTCSKHTTLD